MQTMERECARLGNGIGDAGVHDAVQIVVDRTVELPVWKTSSRAVYLTVGSVLWDVPAHPALQDFLRLCRTQVQTQ